MILAALGIITFDFGNAIVFNCNFNNVNWVNTGVSYTCTATIQGLAVPVLSNVTGNHAENKTNNDVGALAVSNQEMFIIPQNISNFFPNLTILSLSNLRIYRVSSFDIAQFPELQVLILYNNNLDSLDGNLFVRNSLLEYINLSSNQIRHLGPNIFNPLRNLRVLRLQRNICIDEYSENATNILTFCWKAAFNCPPSFEQLESEIVNGYYFQEIINNLQQRIEVLEGKSDNKTIHY